MKSNFPSWVKLMRAVTWDLSYRDLELTEAEADDRAQAIKAKGINTVISFGYHFRWDWISDFERIREVTRRSVEVCHRHGIKYVEHHSACFVTRLQNRTQAEFEFLEKRLPNHTVPEPLGMDAVVEYQGHRLNDWFITDGQTGKPLYWPGYRGLSFCPNNPDYQTRYFAYLEDFLRHTLADGIMSDDVTMGATFYACTCGHCRSLFKTKTGLDLPDAHGLASWRESNSLEFRLWKDFRAKSVENHYARVSALIDKLGRPLLHTSCCNGMSDSAATDAFARQTEYNTTFMEIMHVMCGYYSWRTLFPELRIYRAVAREKGNPSFAIVYPQPAGEEHTFLSAFCRFEDHAVWEAPNVKRQQLNPPGRQTGVRWPPWEAQHEFLFDAIDTVVHVAILFSDETRRYYRGVHFDYYTYEFVGWCQALQAEGIDFDVMLGGEIEQGVPAKYRLMMVPNAGCLTEGQCQQLEEFVKRGGKVIVSHETSLFDAVGNIRGNFLLSDCLGIDYEKTISEDHYPLQAREGDDGFLRGIKGLIPHLQPQVKVRPRDGTQVVATSFVDGGGLYGTSIPAITRCCHGLGEAVYFSGKPGLHSYLAEVRDNSWNGEEPGRFLDYRIPEWGRVIGNAARVLAGSFPVSLEGAKEGVVFRSYRLKDSRLAVHILNASGSMIPHKTLVPLHYDVTYPPISAVDGSNVILQVNLAEKITEARLYTTENDKFVQLDVRNNGAVTEVSVRPKQINRYGVIVLQQTER